MEETLSTALLLFLVFDPFGNAPVFHAVLSRLPESRRRRVLVRELLVAYLILLAFLLGGKPLMGLLALKAPTIGITGGILLFLIALGMVFPTKSVITEDPDGEPFIVPLAVPLIAGPSALAMLLLISSHHPGIHPASLLALTGAWAASAAVLLALPQIFALLGTKGTRAIERLMGLVLIMLAVQMFLDGLEAWMAK